MKMKKINFDKAKDFLFKHGEKVALGACLFLAILFGTMGFLRASSAGKESKTGLGWAEAIRAAINRIKSGQASAKVDPLDPKTEAQLEPTHYVWSKYDSKLENPTLYIQTNEAPTDKRENPNVLAIKSGDKNIQLDYHRAIVFMHDYDSNQRIVKALESDKQGAAAAATNNTLWMKKGEPHRIVVGTAVFPMKQQLEEFRRALRFKSMKDLTDSREDLPQPLGINVVRYEILPGGKRGPAEPLVYYDGKPVPSPKLQSLMRDAIYDEKLAEAFKPYLFEGLVMPMPTIANGVFPLLELNGIDVQGGGMVMPKKEPGVTPPGMPKKSFVLPSLKKKEAQPKKEANVAEQNLTVVSITEKELRKTNIPLADRLFGRPKDQKDTRENFNIFHILGEFLPLKEMDDKKAPPVPGNLQPIEGRYMSAFNDIPPTQAGGAPNAAVELDAAWDRDAIVRFIDPDVKPGKTYCYDVQVRMKNPNFGAYLSGQLKKDLVQYADQSSKPELVPSSVVTTPNITIPPEYDLYAFDQHLVDDWGAGGKADFKLARDHTTFQVHQWLEKYVDFAFGRGDYVVGDWAIAERLDVRKGDPIGKGVFVQVPVWNKDKDGFEVPKSATLKDPANPKKVLSGIRIDLMPPRTGADISNDNAQIPVLVDFFGGKRMKDGKIDEEMSVDALILLPGGKLRVLSSRDASESKERQDRVLSTRRRVEELTGRPAPAGGPPVPGKS